MLDAGTKESLAVLFWFLTGLVWRKLYHPGVEKTILVEEVTMLSNLRLLNDNCSSRVFCVEIAEQLENVLGLTQGA
jgi:hypothetical protein